MSQPARRRTWWGMRVIQHDGSKSGPPMVRGALSRTFRFGGTLAALVILAALSAVPVAASPDAAQGRVAPVAWVRFVNATPDVDRTATFSMAGTSTSAPPYGSAAPLVKVPAGPLEVTLTSAAGVAATSQLAATPMQVITVVLMPPARRGGSPAIAVFTDPPPLLPVDSAAVRVVNAAPDAGTVSATAAGQKLGTVAAGSSTPWEIVPGGQVRVEVGPPTGGIIDAIESDLLAGTASTVLLLGDGERPVHLAALVRENGSPVMAVAPSAIPTDPLHQSGRPAESNLEVVLCALAGAVLLVALGVRANRRHMVRSVLGVLAAASLLAPVACSGPGQARRPVANAESGDRPPALADPAVGVSVGDNNETVPASGGTELTSLKTVTVGGRRSELVATDLDPAGRLMVPPVDRTDPATGARSLLAGWYAQSSAPGGNGPSILIAHRDYDGVTGAFSGIESLQLGDRVVVDSVGSTRTFTVTAVSQFPKAQFPMASVYAPTELPLLVLVTCGGPVEGGRRGRHYRDNVIVTAVAEEVAK